MDFFKKLAESGVNDCVIQFEYTEGQVIVYVSPKTLSKNNPLKSLKPLHIAGTPEQVDSCFMLNLTAHYVEAVAIAPPIPVKEIEVVAEVVKKEEPKVEEVKKTAPQLVKEIADKKKAISTPKVVQPKVVEKHPKEVLFLEYINNLTTDAQWVENQKEIRAKLFELTASQIKSDEINAVRNLLQIKVTNYVPTTEPIKEAVVPPPPPSLKYEFPKPFDAEEPEQTLPGTPFEQMSEQEQMLVEQYQAPKMVGFRYNEDNRGGTGHGDDSYSDADNGL